MTVWCLILGGTLYFTVSTNQERNKRWVKCINQETLLSLIFLQFLYHLSLFFSTLICHSSPTSFSISSYFVLHFPGVPPQVVASGLRPGPDRSPQAFNGCIHNVRINGEHQDLSYRATGGGGKVNTCGKVDSWHIMGTVYLPEIGNREKRIHYCESDGEKSHTIMQLFGSLHSRSV